MVRHGIDLNSEAIRAFGERWKIRSLSVFGSILREDFRQDSDVDFLVEYDPDAGWDLFDACDMREELGAILGRNVDLLTRYAVETDRNTRFKRAIPSTAETVYARWPNKC